MIKKTISSTNSCRFIINKPIDLNIAITYTLNWQPLIGTSAVDKSFIATMVSELASNIIKYATSGYIKLRSYEWPGTIEIEILAIDNGPGIGNIELAMQENFSSGGSLGLGLSGVQRIADKFEILSKVGQGTYVFARKNIMTDKRAKAAPTIKSQNVGTEATNPRMEAMPSKPSQMAISEPPIIKRMNFAFLYQAVFVLALSSLFKNALFKSFSKDARKDSKKKKCFFLAASSKRMMRLSHSTNLSLAISFVSKIVGSSMFELFNFFISSI